MQHRLDVEPGYITAWQMTDKKINPLKPTVAIWVQSRASECPDVKNYK